MPQQMEGYVVPDQLVGEDNWEWCKRVADAIPPEAIVRTIIKNLTDKEKTGRKRAAWSVIGSIMGHGSGVASAIVRKWSQPEKETDMPEPREGDTQTLLVASVAQAEGLVQQLQKAIESAKEGAGCWAEAILEQSKYKGPWRLAIIVEGAEA